MMKSLREWDRFIVQKPERDQLLGVKILYCTIDNKSGERCSEKNYAFIRASKGKYDRSKKLLRVIQKYCEVNSWKI